MNKYKILKELIVSWIDSEKENYSEAKKVSGMNSCAACMALGAIEAYRQVLSDIIELESEGVVVGREE